MKKLHSRAALKHVYYAIYLQIFLGLAACLLLTRLASQGETNFLGPGSVGAMMIFLGINIYAYLRRFEKTLPADSCENMIPAP